MNPRVIHRLGALTLGVVLAVFLFALPAGAAQADDCYPDGCTEPTLPPVDAEVSCTIDVNEGRPGETVTATVDNADGPVRLLLGGNEVAASGEVSGVRRIPAQAQSIALSFAVPPLDPGNYDLVAVGNDFTVQCTLGGVAGFGVLGVSLSRGDGDGDGNKGPLAFTGASILLMILVALALVAIGWFAVRSSRRRSLSRT
ncbi:hypothetical protein [Actinospongicola halichondriae]|uniref:hypothetical protein n=1 Tax=Actinospongicola halichondriae TaxID=3236844 RepID=UPI003D5BAD4C